MSPFDITNYNNKTSKLEAPLMDLVWELEAQIKQVDGLVKKVVDTKVMPVFAAHVWIAEPTADGKYQPDPTGILLVESILSLREALRLQIEKALQSMSAEETARLRLNGGLFNRNGTVLFAGGHEHSYGGTAIAEVYARALERKAYQNHIPQPAILTQSDRGANDEGELSKQIPNPSLAQESRGETQYFKDIKDGEHFGLEGSAWVVIATVPQIARAKELARTNNLHSVTVISPEAIDLWSKLTNKGQEPLDTNLLARRIVNVLKEPANAIYSLSWKKAAKSEKWEAALTAFDGGRLIQFVAGLMGKSKVRRIEHRLDSEKAL